MSADNYYLIRRHPLGGFTPVMGFASDEDHTPSANAHHPQFPTAMDAVNAACREYSEYGVSVHPECDAPNEAATSKDLVVAHASRLWEPQVIPAWLTGPNVHLDGARPIDVLTSRGTAEVLEALEALEALEDDAALAQVALRVARDTGVRHDLHDVIADLGIDLDADDD